MNRHETAAAMEDDPREGRERITNADRERQSGGARSGRGSHYDPDVDDSDDERAARQSER